VTSLGCGFGALALGACATPGYSPGRVESELVQAGATPVEARCVAEKFPDKIDLSALGSHSPPVAITTPAIPPPSTTPPTIIRPTTIRPTTIRPTTTASSTTTTTVPDEYELTRQVLAECGVTLPLQPPP
jgi:hypothetical protein